MKLTITINTENSAFEDDEDMEVSRILIRIAERIASGTDVHKALVMDSNGNSVGQIFVERL